MYAIRKYLKVEKRTIRFKLPQDFRAKSAEVIILPMTEDVSKTRNVKSSKRNGRKYDFSDIAGKLKWKGSALDEQIRLRDEWE